MSATSKSWRKTLPLDPLGEPDPRHEADAHGREQFVRIGPEGNQCNGGQQYTETSAYEGSPAPPIPLAGRRDAERGREQRQRKEERRVPPNHGADPDQDAATGREPQDRIGKQGRHRPDPKRADGSTTN